MEFHDAANIFPLDEDHIGELAEDVKANGLLCPIELLDGKVIDGRRRWMACEKAGIEPDLVEVDPPDPVAYVLSLNLHRRQLTPSQRSMVAARAREFYDQAAKERQKEGGKQHGKGHPKVVENLPQPNGNQKARDQAGKSAGVSGRSVDYATKVLKNGTPALIKVVDEGRMSVSTAAIIASEPPEVQDKEAANPRRNRRYGPVPGGQIVEADPSEASDSEEPPERECRGVGVRHANEAIDCLMRIPKNDPLRKRGFQIVTDWIRRNR